MNGLDSDGAQPLVEGCVPGEPVDEERVDPEVLDGFWRHYHELEARAHTREG